MTTTTRQVTADELLHMRDDGWRYELVRGELRRMTPAGGAHGWRVMKIGGPLYNYVVSQGLGEVFAAEAGFRLSRNPDTVRAPDVAFVRRERVEALGEVAGYWPEAPDLAVEVISPGDLYSEVAEKVAEWLAAGTALVWVVDLRRRTISVHRAPAELRTLAVGDTLDAEPLIPGWRLAVADIFA